jgi:2-polyprenyl-6-methoxyphenol hydroxylase-like FAD-dependent oxidoreductase
MTTSRSVSSTPFTSANSITSANSGAFDPARVVERVTPTGHYDAIVVGARVAGAATAMLLARRGLRVLAVDKSAYGSDTHSSHALMRGAVGKLHRWGLLDRVWDSGTPVITGTTFRYGAKSIDIEIPATDEMPGLAAPRRTVLDAIMVDAAVEAGATVLHRTRLVEIVRDDSGRVRGAALALPDGRVVSLTTDLLIGADGLRSTVARHLDVPITRQGEHAGAYVLQYFQDLDAAPNSYTWLYERDLGGGIIPTNDGMFCAFAGMRPSQFREVGRHDTTAAVAEVFARLDPDMHAAMQRATPVGPARSWPGVRGQFRKAFGPGWALVGDAGYFKDPFAAHGISDAFRDAELLADAAVSGDFQRYESLRDELSAPLFDVLEQIASFDWDLDTLPNLHMQLSVAMREEGRALQAFDAVPVAI